MKALVIGASGKTGRPVVEALAARGVEVRAARRAPVPAGVLFDWADPGTWQEALRDADALYVVGPYMYPDRPALVGDLLAAAPHARRVVLLSVLGVLTLPVADAAVGFVDTRDVAEVTAAAHTEDGHGGPDPRPHRPRGAHVRAGHASPGRGRRPGTAVRRPRRGRARGRDAGGGPRRTFRPFRRSADPAAAGVSGRASRRRRQRESQPPSTASTWPHT
ncbi:NAD(P)H-binding protein [Nonomuraea sp. NBC_00507]|uniref:NAD(P)H-binding protein n=1 Tax=Nonomuraea sp. NBC_00507 TaxID=2976002 RepID=UPI002E180EFC